ncbi:MAG: hypothetical protein KJZ69_14080 [Phycisphaerales bacterium]|nr:hypothetical protein [Phycisphaerales bacterium]
MRRSNRFVVSAAITAMLAAPSLAGAGDLTLEVSGDCPGRLTLRWSGAEPNRPMGIIFAERLGAFVLPAGYCQGTQLGINPAYGRGRLLVVISTRPAGSGSVVGTGSTLDCGGYLQSVVKSGNGLPCVTSNVAQVPR